MNIDLDYTIFFKHSMDLLDGKISDVNTDKLFEDPVIVITENITRYIKNDKLKKFLDIFEKVKDAARGNGGKISLTIDEVQLIGRIRYECDAVVILNSEGDICKKALTSILDFGEDTIIDCENNRLVFIIAMDLLN